MGAAASVTSVDDITEMVHTATEAEARMWAEAILANASREVQEEVRRTLVGPVEDASVLSGPEHEACREEARKLRRSHCEVLKQCVACFEQERRPLISERDSLKAQLISATNDISYLIEINQRFRSASAEVAKSRAARPARRAASSKCVAARKESNPRGRLFSAPSGERKEEEEESYEEESDDVLGELPLLGGGNNAEQVAAIERLTAELAKAKKKAAMMGAKALAAGVILGDGAKANIDRDSANAHVVMLEERAQQLHEQFEQAQLRQEAHLDNHVKSARERLEARRSTMRASKAKLNTSALKKSLPERMRLWKSYSKTLGKAALSMRRAVGS